jgi:Uma2 family endonuclease
MTPSSSRSGSQGNVPKVATVKDHKQELMTTEEYLRTPETLKPNELIYGVLRVADSPLAPHQAAVLDLLLALVEHVRERRLGEMWIAPFDVILDARRALIVQPDLLFVSNERSHIVTNTVRGAPDLVVEVLSPHPRIGKLEERIGWFAEYGVRECWLLHQLEKRMEVLTFENGGIAERASFDQRTPVQSRVLPDFDRTLGSILRWSTR